MKRRKKITLMDIAQFTGVSVATVSRVVHNNGYVAEDKKRDIYNAIDELGYYAKPQSPQTNVASNLIGVILDENKENPYFTYIGNYLSEAANNKEMYTIDYVTSINNKNLFVSVNKLLHENVCGIIVTGFSDAVMSEENCRLLHACNVPVVFIERTGGCFGINRVLLNGKEGMFLATKHLIENGHKHIAYIGPDSNNDVDQERFKGFVAGVSSALDDVKTTVLLEDNDEEPSMYRRGYSHMKKVLHMNPNISGVIAWSDLYAMGAMEYCLEQNKRIPQDISITGFDGIVAPYTTPPLTGVQMPLAEMSRYAVDIIIENKNQTLDFYAKTITLSPKLVIRNSTKIK